MGDYMPITCRHRPLASVSCANDVFTPVMGTVYSCQRCINTGIQQVKLHNPLN